MGLVDKIKDYRSQKKITFDKYVDPLMFWTALNGAYAYGADRLLDYVSQNTDKHEGIAMFGTMAGLVAAWAIANVGIKIKENRYGIIPLAGKIKDLHKKRRSENTEENALSWGITVSQLGALTYLGLTPQFTTAADNLRWDAERVTSAAARESYTQEQIAREEQRVDSTPTPLDNLIPSWLDTNEVRESNRLTKRGQFLRAARWDNILTEKERQYNLPRGLLAGLCMRESYCNPLELNSGADGGAGAFMFQPGTGRSFGLKVYGDSRATGRDRNHGFKLRKLVREHNWDYEELAEIDERFDIEKSADAAAKYLKRLYNRYGSWDKAVSAYNRGEPATLPWATEHVRATMQNQDFYNRERDRYVAAHSPQRKSF